MVYDDYRIAALEDLDTPQLREEVRRRLDRFVARAHHRGAPYKVEAAILLSILLDAEQKVTKKPVPLGICGLMTVIYEDTLDRAMAEVPGAQEIAGEELTELWRSRRMEKDMAALTAATKKAKSLDDLERRITSDPDLSLAWRCQQPHLLEALDDELVQLGADFVPGYFTAEEATLAMDRMEEEHLSKPWHLSRYIMTVTFRQSCRLPVVRCRSRSRGCGYVGNSESSKSFPHIHQPSSWAAGARSG